MNTIVFNKLSGAVLFEDRGAPEREWGSRPYGGVLDSTHARPEVGIPDRPPLNDNLSLRHRTTGYAHPPGTPARLQPGRVGAVSGAGVQVAAGALGLGVQSSQEGGSPPRSRGLYFEGSFSKYRGICSSG